MTFFSSLTMAPSDPILGLTEQFKADTNPKKVNLGVGVYQNSSGRLPLLRCVEKVEKEKAKYPKPRGYQPIHGLSSYNEGTQKLIFGDDSPAVQSGRIVTVQTLGGTGALRVGAQFFYKFSPGSKVLLSDPSWENHQALFTATGFEVENYRYFDQANNGIDFDGMLEDLTAAPAGTVVVLHACCHNPTGYDLTDQQWDQVLELIKSRELFAFIDFAYQGFGVGPDEDAAAIRKFADAGINFMCASSYSKSLGLYGERVGSLSLVCQDEEEAARVLSQVKPIIRTLYSNPPTHGGQVVATILQDPALMEMWLDELTTMRNRIKRNRRNLLKALDAAGVEKDMSFIERQRGMFSYSGMTKDQMVRLRNEFGVYGTDKGRICIAALNERNIDYVASAIAAVIS